MQDKTLERVTEPALVSGWQSDGDGNDRVCEAVGEQRSEQRAKEHVERRQDDVPNREPSAA